MTTLADIAQKAGVSYSTVSRALANSPLVNAETKERIQRLAAEYGYRVNQVARSLATRTTSTLGLVVPETINPFFSKLIDVIVHNARAAGYSLLLNLSGPDQSDEGRCINALYERRVDGIILAIGLNGLVAKEEIRRLRRLGVPFVVLGWIEEADEVDLVAADDAAGARALTRHLIHLGHRRIVLVGPRCARGPYDRICGFRGVLEEAGIFFPDCLRLEVYSEQETRQAIDELLRRSAPPTAIFGYNDLEAAWAMKRLQEHGLRVPEDVAVAGFGDMDFARYLNPGLTSVAYPVEAIGEWAIRLLLNRIRGRERAEGEPPQRHMLLPYVVVRQSCGVRDYQSKPEASLEMEGGGAFQNS